MAKPKGMESKVKTKAEAPKSTIAVQNNKIDENSIAENEAYKNQIDTILTTLTSQASKNETLNEYNKAKMTVLEQASISVNTELRKLKRLIAINFICDLVIIIYLIIRLFV